MKKNYNLIISELYPHYQVLKEIDIEKFWNHCEFFGFPKIVGEVHTSKAKLSNISHLKVREIKFYLENSVWKFDMTSDDEST